MKILKSIKIVMLVIFMASSFSVLSYSQSNVGIDKEKLSNLIDSPKTKRILAEKMGIPEGVVFDMETAAYDPFTANVIVATVDFEYVPLGIHGTASFAHRWVDGEFVYVHSSYWLWGTEVSGDITTDTTWAVAGSPYYVTEDILIENGVSLTIESGTVIRFRKFNEAAAGIDVEGLLICQASVLTTSCDFENYDRSLDYGDWAGIHLASDGQCVLEDTLIEYGGSLYLSSDIGSTVSGCTIRKCYTGINLRESSGTHLIEDNIIADCTEGIYCSHQTSTTQITGNTISCRPSIFGYYGIYCYESSPVISSNTISGAFSYGIRCRDNSLPDVSGNTIQNNYRGIYCYYGASPTIHNNNITGNTYGVSNSYSMVTIAAEDNWWGDASGPYHATLNPGGLGDEVSDYVDFDPWLASVVTMPMFGL